MPDKVMSPENKKVEPGFKQSKSDIVEGSTATLDNMTPYNRSKTVKK